MCLTEEGVEIVARSTVQHVLGKDAEGVFDLCRDPLSLVALVINDCKVGDPPDWWKNLPKSTPSLPSVPEPGRQPFYGTPGDGVIVQNVDGHNLYVAAGGKLFWFDQNNAPLREALLAQRRQRYGEVPFLVMEDGWIHAIEVNHWSDGSYHPGANMPADNTFLYEYGSAQQYVIKYQHPFAIGDPNEAVRLGGQNRAIMVPTSIADLQAYPPQWVQNDLLLFGTDPTVWHYAGSLGYRVPGVPTRDCLQVRWNRGITYMPASAWNYFPTHQTQQKWHAIILNHNIY